MEMYRPPKDIIKKAKTLANADYDSACVLQANCVNLLGFQEAIEGLEGLAETMGSDLGKMKTSITESLGTMTTAMEPVAQELLQRKQEIQILRGALDEGTTNLSRLREKVAALGTDTQQPEKTLKKMNEVLKNVHSSLLSLLRDQKTVAEAIDIQISVLTAPSLSWTTILMLILSVVLLIFQLASLFKSDRRHSYRL